MQPAAREIDEKEEFPAVSVKKLADKGWLGITVSTEYGGLGQDLITLVLAMEEFSKVCASTAIILSTHTVLCSGLVEAYGSEEQKETFLKPLAKGEKIGAFALTEPTAGTDVQGIETTAVKDGNEWVLNGGKIFITNAPEAEIYVIFAVTNPCEQGKKEISAFLVEKGTSGFTFGPKVKKMGIRGASNSELIFKDCRIPAENLLGRPGEGWDMAMNTLYQGRIAVAAQALGIGEGAFERTQKYVKERMQFGRTLSSFQNTKFQMAQMKTKLEAARLLVYEAARCNPQAADFPAKAAMAKLFASETAMEVTEKAVQLHGGYGYLRENEVERMMRDAKITEIYEGTSEVQRMVIADGIFS